MSGGQVLITGGAGFVGTNLADRLLSQGNRVTILDDLSRPGVEQNLRWLQNEHPTGLLVEVADLRDEAALSRGVTGSAAVFHLAAQVAVTTSLLDPVDDLGVNLIGTVKLLEEIRRQDDPPALLFTSTNKVYGALPDVDLLEREASYEPADPDLAARGIDEERPLAFCSPYGCSKGAADQYVLDYCASFGLKTVVFRMSCIYGPHQFGTEDQGWVAHFLIQALKRRPLTIYGDGKQVRDVLFVDDLIDAMLLAQERIDGVQGRAFNIGGGPRNTLSLLQLIGHIEELAGVRPVLEFEDWRVADQRYYVSDTSRFTAATRWTPRVPVLEGVRRLHDWLRERADQGAASLAGTVSR
ncbi:MAG: NAD-dependent epimerase/dehydratase family protein [Actinomycetota bacterium]|nr:NAD-dependent epimerase/dehydratase family protein [Actinomycetota bacterium]